MFNGVRTVPYIERCRNSSVCKMVEEQTAYSMVEDSYITV